MSEYFYGWYFRCQGSEGSAVVIPAVHLSGKKRSCSIQVITQKGSLYREFPIRQFRINREKGILQIGENLFSKKGIRLRFEATSLCSPGGQEKREQKNVPVHGFLRFGQFSEPKYDIMGPFAFLPEMECRHAVYSMKHTVSGVLDLNGAILHFENGLGYMEGDSGTSFPERYLWLQDFWPGGSFMAAAASIPLGKICFTGTLGFLFVNGREYRFATYLGAAVKKMEHGELLIRQGLCQLSIRILQPKGHVLKAPVAGRMTRNIREEIGCRAEITLMKGKQVVFHRVTDQAAAEYEIPEK